MWTVGQQNLKVEVKILIFYLTQNPKIGAMKEITLDTNFNQKMDCNVFLHITFAPKKPVPASELQQTLMITTGDGSHEPVVAQVMDIARIPLNELIDIDCYASYGLSKQDYIDWWMQKYPGCGIKEEMAVYVFRRVAA